MCVVMVVSDGVMFIGLIENDLIYGYLLGKLEDCVVFFKMLDGMNLFKLIVLIN